MKRSISIFLLLVLAFTFPAQGQERVDDQVVARIKMEGFQHSQVLDTLSYLTDVHGPRLKSSPGYKAAGEWARERMTRWGLANASLEPGGFTGRSWVLQRFSVEMIEPRYERLIALPLAWSPSANGVAAGQPIIVDVNGPDDFAKYRGKLRGAIVMNGKPSNKTAVNFEAGARRFSEQDLTQAERMTDPNQNTIGGFSADPYAQAMKSRRERITRRAVIAKFFVEEGVAALITPSVWDSGLLRSKEISMDAGGFDLAAPDFHFPVAEMAAPTFIIAREHYGRIARLIEKNIPVKLEVSLQAATQAAESYNVIAELPGVDARLKDEVVMLGGHLDSWHPGTGATDNAAGCAVMMEAMRILKAIGAAPRRTIRMALWDAEEGGLTGSLTYVKNHFGDPATMRLKPGHEKLSAYFNLDNGSGKIRGVYLQGNEAVRPIFESWLKPFHYLGATTLAIQNAGGTDHLSFDYVGLPGFQFIQDRIDYSTRTHHTNMDVYESVLEEDLKQAAVIIASFAYHTAMRDEKLPRKPLPKAPPRE